MDKAVLEQEVPDTLTQCPLCTEYFAEILGAYAKELLQCAIRPLLRSIACVSET
jgi:hypothetical protein